MKNKAFVLEFVLTAAGFAGGAFAAVNSIPFCEDSGTASLRPDPAGAGEIAVTAPRSHAGAVLKAENFGFSVTNDDNGAAIAAAVREARRVGASKVLLAPGVYRCFGDPIVIDGLVDFELDGCGAELVFRRPLRYPIEPSWDHDGSGANFVIRNCRRMRIGNMVTDWDWRTMPLATCAKVAATHVDDADDESYIDYDLVGCGERHPYYGKTFPVQRTQPMTADFRRFDRGPNIWHGTYEGETGCKTRWLSPTRVRVYPFVEEPGRARWTGPNMRAFSPKQNRDSVRQHKTGETYRIAHAYYGKGGFTLVSNEDFELHDVEIPSCFGHAVYVGGTQRNWMIRNVMVAPRDWRHPISSSADTIHFVRSHGNAIIDNLTVKLEQDDAINVHDRFTVAKKVSPRTLQVVLERGARYFRPGVGNDIELLDPGYNPTGWKGKCVGTEGETILLDRDLPASDPEEGYFLVFDRTASSDGVIIRNCTFEDMEMRTLVNASNATVENCVFRRTNGDALRCIADYTLKWWAEGMGATNVVVRNCRFEGNCVRELVGTYYSLGADFVTWLGCPENVKTERLNRRFISDILVEDCEFVDSLGYFADLRFGTGLKFRNNRIVFTGKRDRSRENSGFARVERVTDVTFEGNVFVRPEGAAEPLVEIADGVDGLALRNNRMGDGVHRSPLTVSSPDGRLQAVFSTDDGGMRWSLLRDGKTLVKPSAMGFRFAIANDYDKDAAEIAAMRVVGARRSSADTAWETSLYRRGKVRDRYNELVVELEETEARAVRIELGGTAAMKHPRRMDIVFRAYDEGVAFRYSFPRQAAFDGFQIKDELTEWRFEPDAMAWTTTYAGERNSQEQPFVRGPLAAVDRTRYVGMPVLVETRGATIALCEAALSNWAGLFYRAADGGGDARLVAALSKLPPSPAATADVAVIAETPSASPWRVAIVGDDELDLVRKNDIIANLNPPPDPSIDFSFVKPGASTWDWWVESNNSLSTELTLKLVDFASEMGWPYHTIDGGWYGFARRPNHGPNVRLEPRKGFDLERIVAHAKEKGVGIWVWIHWMEIEDVGIEETFSRLEKWGVVGVKTDFLERQDQEMVDWCERVCRAAARHRIMVNFHGSFKSTGAERTWPNMITREAVLGNEMSIFRKTVTPAHCATLPFTRFLLGPADFTPGSFANVYSRGFTPQTAKGHRYGDETDRCPCWAEEMGTRAHAIAQCIQFDSPLMTLCDWPERYSGAAGIEALRALPAAWKDTRPVAGKCGEFYAVVREAHDGRFYFAATTVDARTVDLPLDFLGGGEWKMTVYADDPARTPSDAKALCVSSRTVRRGGVERFALCDEGGAIAVFQRDPAPASPEGGVAPSGADSPVERRVEETLARLTLEQKIGQLWQCPGKRMVEPASSDMSGEKLKDSFLAEIRAGRYGSVIGKRGVENYNAIQRAAMEGVGIPLLIGNDMIHSVKTCYPIPLALSCSWDEPLWERIASAMAAESLLEGCNWTFAPMIDVSLDARWGRIAEGGGCDPLLTGLMGAAMIRGFQGEDMADGLHIAACAKHYAAYGAPIGGRDYNAAELSDSTLRDFYLPPFRMAVEAGAATVMPGFHSLNGVPCSMDAYLLRDILRGEMGFDGMTISDWGAVKQLITHGIAQDAADAAEKAINGGMDMEMVSTCYNDNLAGLVESGRVSMKVLDDAVRNVLRVKFRLGLFDRPEIDRAKVASAVDLAANRELAREAARKSIVLLKNENAALPLKSGAKVALLGDVAASDRQMQGCWNTGDMSNFENATLLDGLKADGVDIEYAGAYTLTGRVDVAEIEKAVAGADVVVAAFGDYWEKSGEGNSSSKIELPGEQMKVAEAVKARGKPLVAVVFGGRPMAFAELARLADALVMAWNPGGCGGWGLADVLTGAAEPWGRLSVDMPYNSGTCPLYYSRTTTGRPAIVDGKNPFGQRFTSCYNDVFHGALYPFGYGLAYTTFAYSNESARVEGGDVVFRADVANTGSRPGSELVQVYTHDEVAKIARPRRELKAFRRVELGPGETKHVEIRVPAQSLGYSFSGKYAVEPGWFSAWIAPDSDRGRKLRFELAWPR